MKGYLEGLQSKGGFVLCQLMAFLNMVIKDADQYLVRKTFLFLAVGLLNYVFRFNIKSPVVSRPALMLNLDGYRKFSLVNVSVVVALSNTGKGQNVLSDVMTMAPRSSPASCPVPLLC
jgi:hypothetical protein